MNISDIKQIIKNPTSKGYIIELLDGKKISMHKKRTIPALLTLIKYGEACEADLTSSSLNLEEIKQELKGKIPPNLIQDSYSDANKPFSELWNEEGFTFISNQTKGKLRGSKKYVLKKSDHTKLFGVLKKAERTQPKAETKQKILVKQKGSCNLCGSLLDPKNQTTTPYSKDRIRPCWDHRIPVEKGGNSRQDNYQLLCFYCNKSKWQICNTCEFAPKGCMTCALAYPEKINIIKPTQEDISDRLNRHWESPDK